MGPGSALCVWVRLLIYDCAGGRAIRHSAAMTLLFDKKKKNRHKNIVTIFKTLVRKYRARVKVRLRRFLNI